MSNDLQIEETSTLNRETDDLNSAIIGVDKQTSDRNSLLPRSAWQDRKAFFSTLIKTKRSLDLAELLFYLSK